MFLPRDTVSSVGIVEATLLPLTESCAHITTFRHALALDERRVKFLPEYVFWNDVSGERCLLTKLFNTNGFHYHPRSGKLLFQRCEGSLV